MSCFFYSVYFDYICSSDIVNYSQDIWWKPFPTKSIILTESNHSNVSRTTAPSNEICQLAIDEIGNVIINFVASNMIKSSHSKNAITL